MEANLFAGWILVFLGFAAGAVPGLSFWREDWLGGYASWRRRMIRLAHISFFGLGFINILFAQSVFALPYPFLPGPLIRLASPCLMLGAFAMPAVCYLAAWRQPFRHLFFIPVAFMMIGVALFLMEGFPR